ncbi:MAG: nucleotidyl transferase AbiEii/AbiGii toxin family protein [Anaerolineales bacterium]|nr:nucleotidyl transferase AbiEii/AbiGii toxin family protein [Anaerolineales bacterium]
MIPYLKAQIAETLTAEKQRGIVREYLQMRILQSMQNAGAMIPLAFHGGTALRILYQLPRYSEDLDFALERHPEQYDFRKYLLAIQRDFEAETYDVEIKLSDQKVVHSAFVRFRGLFYQLGISSHQTEVLAIKLEIDTNPPRYAELETTLKQHHVPVHLQHHDQGSLLAGKLHAILQREYVKGRDWYDLFWYLSQSHWASPNVEMLNDALGQSGWTKSVVTNDNWKSYVLERLISLDWDRVTEDVQRFLIEQAELLEFKKATLENLLRL